MLRKLLTAQSQGIKPKIRQNTQSFFFPVAACAQGKYLFLKEKKELSLSVILVFHFRETSWCFSWEIFQLTINEHDSDALFVMMEPEF